MSSNEIKDLCKKKGLDIAIDLCGFTFLNRFEIFAERLAPIQINYLGYPGTMGSSCFDYIIADKTVIPKKEEENYNEKIVTEYFLDIALNNKPTRDYPWPVNQFFK